MLAGKMPNIHINYIANSDVAGNIDWLSESDPAVLMLANFATIKYCLLICYGFICTQQLCFLTFLVGLRWFDSSARIETIVNKK